GHLRRRVPGGDAADHVLARVDGALHAVGGGGYYVVVDRHLGPLGPHHVDDDAGNARRNGGELPLRLLDRVGDRDGSVRRDGLVRGPAEELLRGDQLAEREVRLAEADDDRRRVEELVGAGEAVGGGDVVL